MDIIIKNASVKAYYFISIVEHYYKSLWQVNLIINMKIFVIRPNLIFQIFSKAVNNLINLNKLVFTLLIFNIYPKMAKLNISFLFIIQHFVIIKKAINKV